MTRELMVAQIPSLRRYARALTGDAWAADDLVQDTLERACSKWRLWVIGSNLRAWLFSVMHNLFVNQLRQPSGPLRANLVDVDDVAHDLLAPETDPALMLDLQRCLLRLPPEQREVLLLVSLEDLSYAEVAKITGIPIGTVMSRLSRARSRLQELMEAPPQPLVPQAGSNDKPARPSALRRLK
ncbi:RNA polymerase sigma factor [Rhodoferax sp.]|uniref:RNA polymerase sigma factor n=1 Tax=Rhodoferax sp. TaxID=50421 RepID=UPI00262D6A58|nr:RNA polymerase sigma factor [Rhodoferax sp.]MDD2923664.1 RNA polymerase sigma factor [Rhodoferax sp.]